MKTTQYKNQNIHEHNTHKGPRWTATYLSSDRSIMESKQLKSRYAAKKQINRWNLIHGEVVK